MTKPIAYSLGGIAFGAVLGLWLGDFFDQGLFGDLSLSMTVGTICGAIAGGWIGSLLGRP